jgi:hypothetical protein
MMFVVLKTFELYSYTTQVWNRDVNSLMNVLAQALISLFEMSFELEVLSKEIQFMILTISFSYDENWIFWLFE